LSRYFIRLSFDGTAYHGWQVQDNAVSVQQTLQHALATLLQTNTEVMGCGRTDAGVHASAFFAHFDAGAAGEDLPFRLNSLLPPDIAVQAVWEVPDDAHARFSAMSRTYRYTISRRKDPFRQNTAMTLHVPLDVQRMNDAASLLLQASDFSSFCKQNEQRHENQCKVYSAQWSEEEHLLFFDIRANRFLRNMVRALAGTLLQVGMRDMEPGALQEIIRKRDRRAAGTSLPAKGLCLTDVEYPQELLP